jgi:HEXXH motif-containing protein
MASLPSLFGLTQPRNDISVLRSVLNQHWRVLVHDFVSLAVSGVPPEIAALHNEVREEMQQLLKRDPRAAVRILREPTVAGLIGAIRRRSAQSSGAGPLRELDLLLLTELAIRGELQREHAVEANRDQWPVLRSLPARFAFQPSGTHIVFTPGKVPGGAVGYFPVTGGILFATSDNNPLLAVQGHPERAGNAVDLGGHPLEEWLESLRAALSLIARYQPLIFEEMKLALELIVPVGFDSERHYSVSYEEAVGAIYMTLHPGEMTMAEALIHEFQHNKLNAVFRWDPILHNAHAPLYASPVRPDPRPLHGVLLAVHAFQPVARLYEAMTEAGDPLTKGRDWKKRFRQIIEINREGAATVLTHGRPTPLGAGLLQEIRELDESSARYAAERLV